MSTATATVVGVAVLAAAGALPVLATVGIRWCTVPLAPLAGAVLAAVAATAFVATGGSFLGWFGGLGVLAAVGVVVLWLVRPAARPWAGAGTADGDPVAVRSSSRWVGVVGFVAVVAACAWSLRGLRTPTVGFDARALWVMRPGWFLHDHSQVLVDLRARGLVLSQSAYPPLVSASAAVVWGVTGVHTARLGVTTVAVLNGCALATAALALVEIGRSLAADAGDGVRTLVLQLAGVVAGVAVVLVAAGVTEPFLTNGYADPLWSLAAVGAVAWGLQAPAGRPARAATLVLVLVAGLTKNEGVAAAPAIALLVAARSVGLSGLRAGWRRWAPPIGIAVVELAVIAWWPRLMRSIGARGATTTFTLSGPLASRTSAVAHGMSPYLHVLVLAVPLSVIGALALSGLRRAGGIGNDLWAWAALVAGVTALGGALVTGDGAIEPWIRSTVHRITEFPALAAWWIVACWAVVAAAGLPVGGRGAGSAVPTALQSGSADPTTRTAPAGVAP